MEPVVRLVEVADARHVERALLVGGNPGLGCEERRSEAGTVEAVRPGVVGALEEPLHVPGFLDAEPGAAVAADVVVCAKHPVAVAADDQRAAGNLADEEVPRLRDLVDDRDRYPGAGEDELALERVELL